jgi:hypothetical protein
VKIIARISMLWHDWAFGGRLKVEMRNAVRLRKCQMFRALVVEQNLLTSGNTSVGVKALQENNLIVSLPV